MQIESEKFIAGWEANLEAEWEAEFFFNKRLFKIKQGISLHF